MLSSEAMLNMRFHIIINHMHFTLNIFIILVWFASQEQCKKEENIKKKEIPFNSLLHFRCLEMSR